MDEENFQIILNEKLEKLPQALKIFIEKTSQTFSFPELNHQNYRKRIWDALQNYLRNSTIPHVHADCLASVRILSRDKKDLNELIDDNWINLLSYHACLKDDKALEDGENHIIAIEALKCLCNIIYNSPVAAAVSSKSGILEGIIRRIRNYRNQNSSLDIKYFDMKILFLITALCAEVRPKLKEELHGLTYLMETLDLVLKELSGDLDHNNDIAEQSEKIKLSDNQVDFCCEVLKVLFNITSSDNVDEEEEAHYFRLVTVLHHFLLMPVQNVKKKLELHSNIVNLLTNMPNRCYKPLITPVQDGQIIPKSVQYDEQNMMAIYELIKFLESRFAEQNQTVSSQHGNLSPILTVLLKCACSDRNMRKYLRLQILPPLKDVHHRPEEGNTLRNCLCRLLTTPITQVRDLAAELLFTLCKENVGRMIKYTGYGNAAGLFANRGLLGGRNHKDVSNYSSDSEDSDTEEYREFKHGINPVMGCYEAPHPNPTAGMTEEQKEYEAMKLVELMDNLTRTGVVKPCKIGEDGRPEPIEHVLELRDGLPDQQVHMDDESD